MLATQQPVVLQSTVLPLLAPSIPVALMESTDTACLHPVDETPHILWMGVVTPGAVGLQPIHRDPIST